MGILTITDISNLHDTITSNIEEINEDGNRNDDNRHYLSDVIAIPEDRTLQIYLDLEQTTYSASISILTKRASDFSEFQERATKEICEQTDFKVYELSKDILRLRYQNEKFFSYGIALISTKDDSALNVTMGASGLLVRNAAKKDEFIKAIEGLEQIANITFKPFLNRDGIPKDMFYFLNPL